MPALPSFMETPAAPTNAPIVQQAPFADQNGLRNYIMQVYGELGAEKGAAINDVLKGLGCPGVSDVQPAQYSAFYTGVEALRGK